MKFKDLYFKIIGGGMITFVLLAIINMIILIIKGEATW